MNFDFATLAFLGFAATAAIAALATIAARNPVHAALWLVLTFFSVACTWIVGGAEFLGIALVLVYVGAVMVLFLFVVMMLDLNTETLREGFWKHFPLAAGVGVVIILEMALVLIPGFDVRKPPALDAAAAKLGNTKLLGIEMYTRYLYPLQIAAVLLLVAIIAAIVLTMRHRKGLKVQDIGAQVATRREDRLRVLQMPAEKRE